MNEKDVRQSLDRQLSSVTWTQEDRKAVLLRIREENQPVKRKVSVGFVFALIIVMLASVALATGMGGMMEMINRYLGKGKVLPEAADTLQHELAVAENDYATYTVREAVFDGHQAFVLVEMAPKDKSDLLLNEGIYPADPLSCLLDDETLNQQTIADYAKENGYKRFVEAVAAPESDCSGTEAWKDGVQTVFLSFAYEGDEFPVTLICSAVPYLDEENAAYDQMQSTEISFTLKAAPEKWTLESHEPLEYKQSGLRVDDVKLYGTAMETYYELTFTVTDIDAYNRNVLREFVFLDENDGIIENGLGGGGMQLAEKNGDTIVLRSSLKALNDPPAALTLRIGDVTTDAPAFDEHQLNLR